MLHSDVHSEMDPGNRREPSIRVWIGVSAIPLLLTIGFVALAIIGSRGHFEILMMVPFGLAGLYADWGASQRIAVWLMVLSYMAYGMLALIASFAVSIRLKLALSAILLSIACANLYGCQQMAKGFSKIARTPPEAPKMLPHAADLRAFASPPATCQAERCRVGSVPQRWHS